MDSVDSAAKEQEAVKLINLGNLNEAEAIYRELIAAGTRNHYVYGNLAAICGMQGRFDELIDLLKNALEINADYPEAHNNLGLALKARGELAAAIVSFNKALNLSPHYPEAHYNLGITLKQQGNLTAAIASYGKALELKPHYPDAFNSLGIALKEQGDLTAAISSFCKALELRPNYPDALNNLGIALKEQGDLAAAISSYCKALELRPNYPDALNNLGIALKEQGDLAAAISFCNKALVLNPKFVDAYYNLGNALKAQANLKAAIASYDKALELSPNHAQARFNSSTAMLQGGDYANGLERYEWRLVNNKEAPVLHAQPMCSRWDGSMTHLEGPVLLVSEQGFGDTLQFMRYAIALRDRGISFSLCAQPKLHRLIQVSGIDPSPLAPEQASAVAEGQWMPLLSVPRYLGVSPGNPIIIRPYIRATDELISKWQSLIAGEKWPVIGLNWQGNPESEKANSNGRSLPLEAFAPIAERTNASLISLQKGFGSEQLSTCSFRDRSVCCQPQVDDAWDFLESAAIIANCDLVITSDTYVAHLAGGMGKATWLLLMKVPEWRWGLEGDSSFWYPSMRLFRQQEQGNWDEVLQRIADSLQKEFSGNGLGIKPIS